MYKHVYTQCCLKTQPTESWYACCIQPIVTVVGIIFLCGFSQWIWKHAMYIDSSVDRFCKWLITACSSLLDLKNHEWSQGNEKSDGQDSCKVWRPIENVQSRTTLVITVQRPWRGKGRERNVWCCWESKPWLEISFFSPLCHTQLYCLDITFHCTLFHTRKSSFSKLHFKCLSVNFVYPFIIIKDVSFP